MSYSSDAWNEAFSEVGDGDFIAKILGTAYDSARFKRYHNNVMHDQAWNKEKAANEVIYQAATKMTAQGVRGGIKLAELIPVAGAIVAGGANYWMVNDTGHKFLTKLQQMK